MGKEKRLEEIERQERLSKAKSKKRKVQIQHVEKKIQEGLEKIPSEKRKKIPA